MTAMFAQADTALGAAFSVDHTGGAVRKAAAPKPAAAAATKKDKAAKAPAAKVAAKKPAATAAKDKAAAKAPAAKGAAKKPAAAAKKDKAAKKPAAKKQPQHGGFFDGESADQYDALQASDLQQQAETAQQAWDSADLLSNKDASTSAQSGGGALGDSLSALAAPFGLMLLKQALTRRLQDKDGKTKKPKKDVKPPSARSSASASKPTPRRRATMAGGATNTTAATTEHEDDLVGEFDVALKAIEALLSTSQVGGGR